MSQPLVFTDRTTYLQAVAQWKQDYANLSQTIRDTRRTFRETESQISRGQSTAWSQRERLRAELESLRWEANQMLADRAESKEEAQRQYQAQKADTAVA